MKKPFPKILFQDEHLVVVNKPPGLLTLPDRYAGHLPNVSAFLKEKFGNCYTVHRLDKDTSGILVFALEETSHRSLSIQFEKRQVEKHYLAITEGPVHPEEAIIEKPIGKHPLDPTRMAIHPKGKPSSTSYKVIRQFRNFALLDVVIHTGRMHQIRVHLESIGYPLAIDEVYGRRKELFFTDIKTGKISLSKNKEIRPLMSRSSLHAWKLSFRHPLSGDIRHFEASLPKDFKAVLNQLDTWGN